MTTEPKIPGAVIPRRVFTQPGSFSSDQPAPDSLGMSASLRSRPNLRTAAIRRGVPCMDGARGAREKNLTSPRIVRVQPCIRPLNAAVVAAGPDVIR